MSHTNSTTNYNLPQFVGTDKPAWLGDINPAMTAIDTAIKSAKDAGDTADGKATQAQATADGVATNVGNLTTTVSTLSNTVTAQGGDINNNATNIAQLNSNLNSLIDKFNISHFDSISTIPSITGVVNITDCLLTLAQNSDGSLFKFYGSMYITRNSTSTGSVTKSAIPGLSGYYGIDTGLVLNSTPSEGYVITGGATNIACESASSIVPTAQFNLPFAVGSDGHIYTYASTSQTEYFAGNSQFRTFYWACLYFNSNFGDIGRE